MKGNEREWIRGRGREGQSWKEGREGKLWSGFEKNLLFNKNINKTKINKVSIQNPIAFIYI